MRNRTLTFAIIAATVLALLPQPGFARKKKEGAPKIDPSTLVWPMPPDKPRVRFIEMWENNLQIEPIRKRTWADKLAGVAAKNVLEDFGKPAGIIDKEHKQLARIPGEFGHPDKNGADQTTPGSTKMSYSICLDMKTHLPRQIVMGTGGLVTT